MENTVKILPLTNEYCRQAAELILPIQRVEFGVPITLADQPDLMDLEGSYFLPGGHFWGALVNGELVGTIGLLVPGHRMGVIRKMFVKDGFRGKERSIAKRLLDILIRYSEDKQMTDLYLGTVDRMKAAHRFYEKNGFVRIAKEDLPAAFPLMSLDNVFYHRNLLSTKDLHHERN
jgi:N-acetylglutamate synthase-like GNAT family acetyltransferase